MSETGWRTRKCDCGHQADDHFGANHGCTLCRCEGFSEAAGEPDPERVERVAEAIRSAWPGISDSNYVEWAAMPASVREDYRTIARAAIHAYEERRG